MKWILFLIIILLSIFSARSASAAITYSRTPSGSSITSPVSFDVSFTDFLSDTQLTSPCGGASDCQYWGVGVVDISNNLYLSSCVASTTTSMSPSFNLPTADYTLVEFTGGITQNDCENVLTTQGGTALEGNGSDVAFTVTAAPAPSSVQPLFSAPSSTAQNALAYVTATIADPSVFTLVAVAIAIPLVFAIIGLLIGLF